MTAFPYHKVLILGATSGIGQALAERILSESDASVVIVGRRQDRLDDFVKKHGNRRVSSAQFDVTRLSEIEGFVSRYVHSSLDGEKPDAEKMHKSHSGPP